jgi:CubicO group peptidase (beta-lactamase class C family)
MASVLVAITCLGAVASPASPRALDPGPRWERVAAPEEVGYPPARLQALRERLAGGQTTAMLVAVGGHVLFEYGDVAETSYVASVRKSVVSMLYGKYVADGTIPLRRTLRELAFTDQGGLLDRELEATVGDLLAARSGIYHPAANLGDATARAPARGSVVPGRYFLYNNWDFNALEAILERVTGRSLYALFTADLARPLGLEDWNPDPAAHAPAVRNDTGLSSHPAHHFVLSTRDMARIGHLMLRHGRWGSRQVVPESWVARSTATVTRAEEVARTSPFVAGLGYGLLWWTFDEAPVGSPLRGAYSASGAFGQFITVVPALDMVVAHKTAVPPARNVSSEVYFGTILPLLVGQGPAALKGR